jgi:hypothetical protein
MNKYTLRERIAKWLIGDRTFLFIGETDKSTMYTGLDDSTLGKMTRRWFRALNVTADMVAKEKGTPPYIFATQMAVLSFADAMVRQKASIGTFAVANVDTGNGSLTGNFRLTVEKLPDGHVFGELGTNEAYDEAGNLVGFAVHWQKEETHDA